MALKLSELPALDQPKFSGKKFKGLRNRYKIINHIDQVYELIEYIETTKICSLDFETSSLNMFDDDEYITVMGISFQIGSSYIIPLWHFESPFSSEEALKILQLFSRRILTNTRIIKIAQNIKFEWKWLKRYGCELQGRLYDTMIAKFYLDENTSMGLKEMVADKIPDYAGYDDDIEVAKKKYGGWAKIPLEILCPYNALDTDLTLRLMIYLHKRLIENDFYKLFRNLRMAGARLLAETEFHGVRVNREYLDEQTKRYEKKISKQEKALFKHPKVVSYLKLRRREFKINMIREVKKEVKELLKTEGPQKAATKIANRQAKILKIKAGEFTSKKDREKMEFNFGSTKQISHLFYEAEYGFQFPILEKTKKGAPSTGEAALEKLKSKDKTGFINQLLELRSTRQLDSFFLTGMYKNLDKNNYVHPNFGLTTTVTHRLSCVEPNLQQVPRVLTNPDIKPMFEPPKGYLHFEADYSQAELRVVAELAQDKAMIDIFKRGYNIHNATACLVNGRIDDYDEIYAIMKNEEHTENEYWLREKKKAKTINFGILYGQGDEKLAEGMGVTVKEAKAFKKKWFAAYPQVVKWIENQQKFAKKHGYVKSIWGYKRRLPTIWSDRKWEKAEAERQSVNAPIQGAASDYTLFAAIELREMRLRGKLPPYLIMRIIVHDALDHFLKPKDVNWVVPIVVEVMSKPKTKEWFGFEMSKVDMKASVELGSNWANVEDYKEDKDWQTIVKKKHYLN